jgi:hypothetical protein
MLRRLTSLFGDQQPPSASQQPVDDDPLAQAVRALMLVQPIEETRKGASALLGRKTTIKYGGGGQMRVVHISRALQAVSSRMLARQNLSALFLDRNCFGDN